MGLSSFDNHLKRKNFLEKELKVKLTDIDKSLIDEEQNVHCENLLGAITIPLGVAGPVLINGESVKGKFYIPLATTEGALVASVNRGCKVISLSSGVNVYAYRVGATRGPVFAVDSLEKNRLLFRWLHQNEKKIKQIAEATSSHLFYKKMMIGGLANYVFVRFYFDTQDAMGMNMVTIATQKIVDFIEKETEIRCLSIAGNFDIDKKPAWINFIENRGFKVWAEAIIKADAVKKFLKTTPQKIFDVWLAKCMIGSAMSGSLGFNAHFANIVAAIFAATGQDLAHIAEGSMGITTAQILHDGSLYISIYLPALMLGTIGGGTGLKTQTEARNIMGVKKSSELAEVLGTAVLAGELSLLASLAEGSLTKAHVKLGR